MFHRAIAPHGQNTEGTEKRFRTRALHRVIVQEVVRRRRICHPSSEQYFFLQWHYMEHSATGNCVVLHAGIWQRGGGGGEDRMQQAKSLERQEEFRDRW